MSLLLSIIIPVYNVEKYIRTCIESIFCQDLSEDYFEVIIINDGSTDNSIEVISDIIQKHHNIAVVNQENKGISVARNNGIQMAKGEYILMPDSDDLFVNHSLKRLLNVIIERKPDLLVTSFKQMNNNEIEDFKKKQLQQPQFIIEEKTGRELFYEELPNLCFVWRVFYKRRFILENNLSFVPGIYVQDKPFIHECYLKANKCIKTSQIMYIYRRGHYSASSSFSKKYVKDYFTSLSKTWFLTEIEELPENIKTKIKDNVFTMLSQFIWILIHDKKYSEKKIEYIDLLKPFLPQFKFEHGLKQKFISFILNTAPHTYLRIRSLFT